ncbi:RluA family pseudouridine synthase [Paenibacillus sp. GSMTC-2017]|uniref:RluA family pseudouridine synthase n=1 Tax=Paenibacillus sp. GSMTC-2017 TaxID=2794350 RepID=UPI0018D839A1|nr:RluA family pseudouridine synthase [Paenibacillus sp. GSMTC-2017]MBH5317878.1 RluA family pseudouridine synthase [Paenibacillus sp. GSMTC-2017]
MRIKVLFEDNHLLAVVKPPGIPSQEDETGDPDMLTLLKADLKERHQKPGNVFLGLVHRLDRPVGGVMIFAKTSKAASRLSEAVRSRNFGKTYMCVVQGAPAKQEARLTHYIRKDQKKNQVTVFEKPTEEAKEAILTYSVIASSDRFSLIAVKLHTGRSHQIRAQMAYIGCPLLGDLKYGATKRNDVTDVALWSTSVSVPHPVTKEASTFCSTPENEYPWSIWQQDQIQDAAKHFT